MSGFFLHLKLCVSPFLPFVAFTFLPFTFYLLPFYLVGPGFCRVFASFSGQILWRLNSSIRSKEIKSQAQGRSQILGGGEGWSEGDIFFYLFYLKKNSAPSLLYLYIRRRRGGGGGLSPFFFTPLKEIKIPFI